MRLRTLLKRLILLVGLALYLSFSLGFVQAQQESTTIYNTGGQDPGQDDWRMNVITDPAISARCNELEQDRRDKIEVKQRLMALVRRADKAQKITPEEKKSIFRKLEDTNVKLQNELHLTRLKIETLEEHIIRQGCPGIRL